MLGTFPPIRGGIATFLHHLMESPLHRDYVLLKFQTMSRKQGTVDYFRESVPEKMLRVLWDLGRYLWFAERQRPDAVHINTSFGAWSLWRDLAYLFLSKAMRKPVLFQIQGGIADQFLEKQPVWKRRIAVSLMKRADRIGVCSKIQRDGFSIYGLRDRVLVLPNMVPANLNLDQNRQAVRDAFRIPRRAVVLLFVSAQFHRAKGVLELLDAFSRIKPLNSKAVLVMAGGGSQDKDVLDRLAREQKNGSLILTGHLPLESLERLLPAADIFILPSYAEGLPLCVMEAMAAGLPVIATPVGGIPDLIEDGTNGYLVPVRDVKLLADRMSRLIRNSRLRKQMGENGIETLLSRYGKAVAAKTYDDLYQTLVRGSHVSNR
ncbi:MAG TPA: glycosyltransferase family 4 protein [bacterium]